MARVQREGPLCCLAKGILVRVLMANDKGDLRTIYHHSHQVDSHQECPLDRRAKEKKPPDSKKSHMSKASQGELLGDHHSLEGHKWPGALSAFPRSPALPGIWAADSCGFTPVQDKDQYGSLIGGWHFASRHCYGW